MTSTARQGSRSEWRRTLVVSLACLVLALAFTATARAQDEDREQLLEDFVHYVLTARPDLAEGYAQTLIDSGITNAEIAALVDGSDPKKFDRAIDRALRQAELEDIAGDLSLRVEVGRLDLARDGERIDQAIQMLVGTQRQKMLAAGRLEAAGEYAVPALLQAITDGKDERLKQESQRMLRQVGRQAVTPLSVALAEVDPQSQRVICDLVGDIGYAHAAPYLRDIAIDDATAEFVREAADRAFISVRGVDADLSQLYSSLARQFYGDLGSLIGYPYEATNNVWSYDPFVGLVATPVPTSIFSEVMTMKLATRALELDPGNEEALALFVAADLKRENDLPEGESDPIYGDKKYTPEFYATVFGTRIALDVLALAIDTNDTPLVRDAIAALQKTTGGANLFTADGGRRPLLEALSYPDRRVQYEAALTLAGALPNERFDGDYRVVPILASAVRTGGETFALVIADDEENRSQAMIDLERNDFTILGADGRVGAMSDVIGDAVAVDVVVIRMVDMETAIQTIDELRGLPKTAAAPVLVLASGVDIPSLKRQYRSERHVHLVKPGVDEMAYTIALEELLKRSTGGRMTEAEAEAYAFEALAALEDISISCSPAYALEDAEVALLDSLDARTGRARLLVANILARLDSERAQRQIFDAALSASGGEQIDLLEAVAASVKRFGDRTDHRQILALQELVKMSTGSVAEAAARVHGALNLPAAEAVKLIEAPEES